jgi:hypothetical protein
MYLADKALRQADIMSHLAENVSICRDKEKVGTNRIPNIDKSLNPKTNYYLD